MGTTSDKLNYLLDTKTQIKQALIDKGQTITDNDTFRSYAQKIEDIENGTEDATLQAKYLLQGYEAVVNGQLIQGTMPERGTVTITATSNDIIIPEGHYNSLSIPIINAANCTDYIECNNAILSI